MTGNVLIGAGLMAVTALDVWQVGMSVAIFVSVLLVVLAVFGQPGKIRISPQREAALATGHSDRRTVFEKPLTRPVMWLLLAVSHRLALPHLKRWLRSTLIAAGSPKYYTPEEYLALGLLCGSVLGVFLGLVSMMLTGGQVSLFAMLLGLLIGTGLTIYQIYDKAAKRLRLISRRMPYALDLVALAMGAGATFTEAVRTVVREVTDDPFNVELKRLLAEMELGTTRRRALENLADRIPLDPLRSIVSSVIQAEELGTPLAEVLHAQADLLRLQRSVRAENAAAVASVRILVPGLLIMIAVVLVVLGPAVIRGMRGGLF